MLSLKGFASFFLRKGLRNERAIGYLKIVFFWTTLMSILQISLGIMKITNNIVNHIDFYEDCPFKIPML